MDSEKKVEDFIARWKHSGGSEMANFQSFATELVHLLDVERIKVADADGQNNDYRFERPVTFTHTGRERRGRIDLYRKDCFILEAKQIGPANRGAASFDDTMMKARNQADNYARAVSKEDGWPPFLLIVDVGNVIELYADFSRQGQGYTQFPDGNRYRIMLDDLAHDETRDLLRTIWTDPFSLDPSRIAAEVTRDIATHLAELGRSFEAQGHNSESVARFLMRCLFSMFAEDVDLIPRDSFTDLLRSLRGHVDHAQPSLKSLWEVMNKGGFSPILRQDLKRFNGGLFRESDALPLNDTQLELLIEAAEADWRQVEPAIFGTLLERALDKRQRHKLGAHYTPRAYVERLVTPTIMDPLRSDWRDVQAAVQRLTEDGKQDKALDLVREFHRTLCETRVLDPACGSGNFLYVALEMMKRLEGEVTALMQELGETQRSFLTVDPHQFLGIEVNPWAANVAELVLWIGYLQWHYRTHGTAAPSEPVLRDFKNIRTGDALLTWDEMTLRHDADGKPVTRWDGITTMKHPVTGEEVPDPNARLELYDYANAKPADWPDAEFIVGNPPFIGASRMREALGDGYAETLWKTYPKMPQSADFVMFWWEKAALKARAFNGKKRKGTRRFGLITTNSLRQTFNRRVLEPHLADPKKPLSLLFAIPDHPWVDTLYGAAVRIAMTVAGAGNRAGQLLTVTNERREKNEAEGRPVTFNLRVGKIFANLQIGADVASCKSLAANAGLSSPGVKLHGSGFIVSKEQAKTLGLGRIEGADHVIRPYRNGRDLTSKPRDVMVIDLFGLSESDVTGRFPEIYQHISDTVKPERNQNNRAVYKRNWWIFGEPRRDLRPALRDLDRYIVTVETMKHRVFQFLDTGTLADNKLIIISIEDAAIISILSSRQHVVWSLAAGSWLGVGNDPVYAKTKCFDPFPFAVLTDDQRKTLRTLGEDLDAHRKRQQAEHPTLTLTQMYNVLEKLRAGAALDDKDRDIYDKGLIGILKDIHDRIDAAVAEAYGWPADLSDEEILERLVALNKERSAEEANGLIRWLRPDYQNPDGRQVAKGKQAELDVGAVAASGKAAWPKDLPEQIAAVREALADLGEATPEQIARRFVRARTTTVLPLLRSLAALGDAEQLDDDRFAA